MIAQTEVLKSEHRVIEKVITTMDWVGRTLLRGKRVDPSLIEEITDFMEKRKMCSSSGWSAWVSLKREGR
ncbi:MAG: hypothetical protein QXM12_02620 [Nitrososphaerota archaeon]